MAPRSRRLFLQQVGMGSGLVGLGALGGLAIPQSVLAACPPAGAGAGVRWRRDCRPIRPRRPASTLSTAEIQKLRDAYAAMRALDTSDPTDPRGFFAQAQIHCWYCNEIASADKVHRNWRFFAFHRAYLYFHERILGKLIGDMDFRLPYWDWDSPSHRAMPAAYTDTTGSNPLLNTTRVLGPADELPDEDVGADVMNNALSAGSFSEFGGGPSSKGIAESAPHDPVHGDVSGDMGTFQTAGRDPLFYAHHSNVDKLWTDWNKAASTHLNPTDPAFLNLSWSFYDENKIWRSITADHVLNNENQLRYVYGPSLWIEKLLCLLDWIIIRTNWRAQKVVVWPPELRRRLLAVVDRGGRVRIHIRGLQIPTDRTAVYRLYLDPRIAKADPGPEGPGYVGIVTYVMNSRDDRHRQHESQTTDLILTLKPKTIEALAKAEAGMPLALIERGGKDARVLPVRANDVYFSYADVEK